MIYKDINYNKLIQSSEWRRVRNSYLQAHPTCERCGRLATQVHHIQPLNRFIADLPKMYQMCFDEDNLMSVCDDCHIKLHQELGKFNGKANKEYRKEKLEAFRKNYFE